MEGRPLVASAASGSFTSLLVWLLHGVLAGQKEFLPQPPLDLDITSIPRTLEFNHCEFWCGVLVGFTLWPIIEILVLIKQWVTLSLRNRISGASSSSARLYRVN